jgi:SAM-dependent methyltransferase
MEYEGLQGASLGERANRLTAAGFDQVHVAAAKSTLLREFAALAYGDEYPAEVAPTGMTTWWILGRCIAGLRVGPGERLVDLGCGSGGPGLWLARASGADLVGVDWSHVAVEAARRRAADFLPDGRARFVVGELADSGLPTDEADAVLCLDAVFFAPDRVAALREVRRLLRPDGRYVFSATEVDSPPDRSWVTDWQPLLAAADLEIESKDEVPHYAERLQRMYDLWLENLEALEAEVGFETAAKLEQEARAVAPTLQQRRQFLIVARS